jgi:hypothetical protein
VLAREGDDLFTRHRALLGRDAHGSPRGGAAGAAMDSQASGGGSSRRRRLALQHNGSAGGPALAHRPGLVLMTHRGRDSGGLTWICNLG